MHEEEGIHIIHIHTLASDTVLSMYFSIRENQNELTSFYFSRIINAEDLRIFMNKRIIF